MKYLIIAGSSAAVYIFIVAAVRLFGKKEFSQLSITDLVFVLLISNAVQNAMVGPDTSLLGGLCAAGTLFLVNSTLKYIEYKFPQLSRTVQGSPVMLIYEGEMQVENMQRMKVSVDEIEEAAREHGVAGVEEVSLAVLEMDGNISILSNDFKSKTKRKRRRYTEHSG